MRVKHDEDDGRRFHVAPAAARASIEAHGIDALRRVVDIWSDRPVHPIGSAMYPEGNYLWSTEADAQAYVEYSVGWPGTAWDIWAVDTAGLELDDDPQAVEMFRWSQGLDYTPSALVRKPIPPERLTHWSRVFPSKNSGDADTPRSSRDEPRQNREPGASADVPQRLIDEVCRIFAETLHMDSVRASDDFFDLGGHSLLAASVITRIRRELGMSVLFQEFFADPTPAAVARALEPAG